MDTSYREKAAKRTGTDAPIKVVLIFDSLVRADTTGVHIFRALQQQGIKVEHFEPLHYTDRGDLSFKGYQDLCHDADLYLQIDDDIGYPSPAGFHPSAYYCIDTHRLDAPLVGSSLTRPQKAKGFDYVFSAQQDGVQLLAAQGVASHWLPLAYDPELWSPDSAKSKEFDWCFIGTITPERRGLCAELAKTFPRCVFGQAYGDAQLSIYQRSRVILNLPILNDVNMRFFEAIGAGGLLVTTQVGNGEDQLLPSVVTFRDHKELAHTLSWIMTHEEERAQLAAMQHQVARSRHTYARRIESILELIAALRTTTNIQSSRLPEPKDLLAF